MSVVLALVLHLAVVLAGAPLLAGLTATARQRLLGQAGSSPVQPYRDAIRLWRKQAVIADGASPLYHAAPIAQFAALGTAAALVPSLAHGMAMASAADLIVVLGLLAGAGAVGVLAAMDIGTAPGGTAASRAATFGALAEPILFLGAITLGLSAGSTNLDAIAASLRDGAPGRLLPLGIGALAAGTLAFARLDDPDAAQGLAEYGGRKLAMMRWNAALRRLVWLGLFASLIPFGTGDASVPSSWPLGLVAWAMKILFLEAAATLVATLRATPSASRTREALGVAMLIAVLAALAMFAGQGGA